MDPNQHNGNQGNPLEHKHLIGLKDLEYIIELVILSGWIKNTDPLSLIISAKVGAGKTELLKQYSKLKGVKFLSEPTAYGIKTKYLDAIKSGKIRTLMIGDLLGPLSKQKKTRDDFIAFLNTVMEEGILEIQTYAQEWESKKFVKCGLITTIAEPDLLRKSRRWFEMGFLTRSIPLTYSYSDSTKIDIYQGIAKSKNLSRTPKKLMWLPKKPVIIKQNSRINLKLIELSMNIEKWEDVYGFRRQEQLQTLLMANSLKNKRKYVTEEDYDKIIELSKYINLSFKEV